MSFFFRNIYPVINNKNKNKMENQKTKVDFTSQIEEKVFNYEVQELDGSITSKSLKKLEGTISVWEQRILYKYNMMTGVLNCTVTDFEDLIDYDVKFTERKINFTKS